MVSSLTRTAAAEVVHKFLSTGVQLPTYAVGTLHSHAFRSLGMPKIAAGNLIEEWNQANPTLALTTTAEGDLDDPDYERNAGKTDGDRRLELYELARHRRNPRPWPDEVEIFSARWEAWKKSLGIMDFTDLIERALKDVDIAPYSPKVMLADEAQDLSRLEYELLAKWGKGCEAMFIVGDPWQALYTWRGADPGVLTDSTVASERSKVLKQSYRVPKAVHAAAVNWVKKNLSTYTPIEYAPTPAEGSVEVPGNDLHYGNPDGVLKVVEKYLSTGKSVMIQTSCSYMLPGLLSAIRQSGIPYSNPWRRRRGDWNPLTPGRGVSMAQRILDFLRPDVGTYGEPKGFPEEQEAIMQAFVANTGGSPYAVDTGARPWTYAEMSRWVDAIKTTGVLPMGGKDILMGIGSKTPDCDKLIMPNDFDFIFTEETAPIMQGFLSSQWDTKKALQWYESKLSAAKRKSAEYPMQVARTRGAKALATPPRLYIGTIHSFKGAEADVVIIFPDISPAGWQEWEGTKQQRDSIVRLFYVALTRAKEKVLIGSPFTRMSVPLTDCRMF